MFNRRTLTVLKRELREKLFSKTFIFMTLLIPVFMFGILGMQTFIMTFEGDEGTKIEIISESETIKEKLQAEFLSQPFIKNGYYKVSYYSFSRNELDSYLQKKRRDIYDEKINAVVYIPNSALKNKKAEYYSKNPNNEVISGKLGRTINKVLTSVYFEGKKLTEDEISFARENVNFNDFRITKGDKIEEAGYGNTVASFLFTFLLYISLLLIGSMMMRSVVEEKNNRIVEIILSSVSSSELMSGKIFGTAITGLLQMAIWLLPAVVIISTTWFSLPPDLTLQLDGYQILYFLLNYFLALVTFLGLFACVGAIFDNEQDAQSGLWPIMILIIIPFFIAIGMMSNPDNQIARIASMLPFASLIVMPARITLVDVPLWQFFVSLAVSILTLLVIFPVSGKIYRVGILITGKKPKWSEVIKWLKEK